MAPHREASWIKRWAKENGLRTRRNRDRDIPYSELDWWHAPLARKRGHISQLDEGWLSIAIDTTRPSMRAKYRKPLEALGATCQCEADDGLFMQLPAKAWCQDAEDLLNPLRIPRSSASSVAALREHRKQTS